MKKIFKLFGIMIAVTTLMCLSSCDQLLNLGENENDEVLTHSFVIDMGDKDITKQIYIYYTSTTRFSYGDHPSCYYQMVFSKQGNTWKLYTRPVDSMTKINDVGEGTFGSKESVITEGTVTLSDKETITIKKNSDGKLYFTLNVAASHKAIGAKDSK